MLTAAFARLNVATTCLHRAIRPKPKTVQVLHPASRYGCTSASTKLRHFARKVSWEAL